MRNKPSVRILEIVLVIFASVIFSVPAGADLCALKNGTYDVSSTPCTTADGNGDDYIDLVFELGEDIAVDIVYEQSAEPYGVWLFNYLMFYDTANMDGTTATCNPNPEGYFTSQMGHGMGLNVCTTPPSGNPGDAVDGAGKKIVQNVFLNWDNAPPVNFVLSEVVFDNGYITGCPNLNPGSEKFTFDFSLDSANPTDVVLKNPQGDSCYVFSDISGDCGPMGIDLQDMIKSRVFYDNGSCMNLTPTPAAPTDGYLLGSATQTFSWILIDRPDITYDLQVSTDTSFLTTVVEKTGLADTSYTLSGTPPELLENATTYYWRVRSDCPATPPGNYSDYFTITTDTTPVAPLPFTDDVESGTNGWAADGLWHIVDDATSPCPLSNSPTHSWWYGSDITCDYDTGAQTAGSLTSPPLDFSGVTDPVLSFNYYYETDGDPLLDLMYVEIFDGAEWVELEQLQGAPMSAWNEKTIFLAPYSGNTVKIRFRFDSVDEVSNDFHGWNVDDILVEQDSTPPEITSTTPADEATDVELDAPVVVSFSEPMNPGTALLSSTPDPGGWIAAWNVDNTIATFTHNNFSFAATYTIEITAGNDAAGNPLAAGAVPNPWNFTAAEDTQAPATPTPLIPDDGAYSETTPTFSWTEVTDISGVTYDLQVSSNPDFGVPEIDITDIPSNSHTLSGTPPELLSNSTVYHWRVRAMDGANNASGFSSTLSFTVELTPPASIQYVYDGSGGDTDYTSSLSELKANWAASSDPESGIDHYEVWVGTSAQASDTVPLQSATQTSATFSGLTLTEGTTYYTTVKAVNGAGMENSPVCSNGQTVDVSVLPAPDYVYDGMSEDLDMTDSASMSVTWGASAGADRYWIAAGTGPAGATDTFDWTDAGASTTFSADLAGTLVDGETCYFSVKAEKIAGKYSEMATSDGILYDISPPVFSGIVSSTGTVTPGEALLSWSAADDPAGPVTYNLYMDTSTGSLFDTPAEESISATSTTVSGLDIEVTYYFGVRAKDTLDHEDTNTINVSLLFAITDTTPPAPPTRFRADPGDARAYLSWENPSDDDFAEVRLRRSTSAYPSSISEGDSAYQGTGTFTTDPALANTTPYYYSLFACDSVPNCSYATATVIPGAESAMDLYAGWNLITLGTEPQDGATGTIFSGMDDVQVWMYSAGVLVHESDASFGDMAQGKNYWIFSDERRESIGYTGTPCTGDTFEIPLKPGWSGIGTPYSGVTPFNDTHFEIKEGAGAAAPMSGFISAEKIDSATWYFDTETETYSSYEFGSGAALIPWTGYWIYTKQDNLTLVVKKP